MAIEFEWDWHWRNPFEAFANVMNVAGQAIGTVAADAVINVGKGVTSSIGSTITSGGSANYSNNSTATNFFSTGTGLLLIGAAGFIIWKLTNKKSYYKKRS